MCTVLLPPGGNPIAFNKCIIFCVPAVGLVYVSFFLGYGPTSVSDWCPSFRESSGLIFKGRIVNCSLSMDSQSLERSPRFCINIGHKSSSETIQRPTRTDVPTAPLRRDENSNRSTCYVRPVSTAMRITFIPQTVVNIHRSAHKARDDRLRHRLFHSCLYLQ